MSCCHDLVTLEVGGTKLTGMSAIVFSSFEGNCSRSEEGLISIIDDCPRLINLDLTSCRGVDVINRRRFFEVPH